MLPDVGFACDDESSPTASLGLAIYEPDIFLRPHSALRGASVGVGIELGSPQWSHSRGSHDDQKMRRRVDAGR